MRRYRSCPGYATNVNPRLCQVDPNLGIGQAICVSLALSGANLALIDFDTERQARTKALCESHGVKAFAYGANVVDQDRVKAVFEQIERDLGPVE